MDELTPKEISACHQDIIQRLRSAKRRMSLLCLTEGLANLCIAWVALSTILLSLDAWFALPLQGRIAACLVALLALAVLVARTAFLPVLHALSLPLHRLALSLEERLPGLESRLVTVLDLYPALDRPATETQRGFVCLAIQSAHRDTLPVDFRSAIPAEGALHRARTAATLLLAGLLFALLSPGGLQTRLARYTGLWQEFRQEHADASLQVEVVETDVVHLIKEAGTTEVAAIRGSDVHVRVSAQCSVPAPLLLFSRPVGAPQFSSRAYDAPRTSRVTLHEVTRDTEFFFRLGLAATPTLRIRATDYPRITRVELRFRFPDYTGVRPQFVPLSDGKISALYRTEVEVSVEADKALQRGAFTLYGKRIGVKGQGTRIATRFLVTESSSYSVEIVDRDGFSCPDAFERPIEALRDQNPVLEVAAADEMLLGKSQLSGVSVRFRAQDDYGIETIRLLYQVGSLPGVRLAQPRSPGVRALERKIEPRRVVSLNLPCGFDALGLEVGETVTFQLEVEDTDRETGPHTARSKSMRVVVVGTELGDWMELVDEDQWPTDFAGFAGAKAASGIGRPGLVEFVREAGERPNESSAGVTSAAEGAVPQPLRDGFFDYSSSLNERR